MCKMLTVHVNTVYEECGNASKLHFLDKYISFAYHMLPQSVFGDKHIDLLCTIKGAVSID